MRAKVHRGCSPETVRRYRWAAARTDAVLRAGGRTRDPARWTPLDARWLRAAFHQERRQLEQAAALARFCGNDVFRRVGLPHAGPPKRVRWLSDEQTDALLDVSRRDRHLRLVVLLGLAQGLRRGDWVHLKLSDIDLDRGRLRIAVRPGASGRGEWVAMHPALPEPLRNYLWLRRRKVRRFLRQRPGVPVPEELFLHVRDGALTPYRPHGTDRWVGILERRMAARGVKVRLSTDMLRRRGVVLLQRSLRERPGATAEDLERSVKQFLRLKTARVARRRVLSLRARSELSESDRRTGGEPAPRGRTVRPQ